jgi:hypothetical protein
MVLQTESVNTNEKNRTWYQSVWFYWGIAIIATIVSLYFSLTSLEGSLFNKIMTHLTIALFDLALVIVIFEILLRTENTLKTKEIFNEQISILGDESKKMIVQFNEMNKKTAQQFSILQVAKDGNIFKIYNERDEIKEDLTTFLNLQYFENIAKEINFFEENIPCKAKRKFEIDMVGITLRGFFGDRNPIFKKVFLDFLKTVINTSSENIDSFNFRIMILYPYSNLAVIRAIREYTKKFEGRKEFSEQDINKMIVGLEELPLYKETHTCINCFQRYKDELFTKTKTDSKNINVKFEVKIITLNPMEFILRLDNLMFVEPYHLGYDHTSHEIVSGKVIVTAFKKGKNFDLFKNHFDFLWKDPTSIDLDKMIKEKDNIPLNYYFLKPEDLDSETKNRVQQMITTYMVAKQKV